MKLNIWSLMIQKDTLIIGIIHKVLYFLEKLNISRDIRSARDSSKVYHDKYNKEEVYIILNGPSIKKQDLNKLKGKNLMFVNRGFKHHLYEDLKPKFHVFVDPKMVNGIWSLSWLDEIVSKAPEIIFIMPEKWSTLPEVKEYIKKGYNFLWVKESEKMNCIGVAGTCFSSSILMGFKKLYFTGFEATGLPHEILKNSETHFYGQSEENAAKTSKDYIVDLYMYSRQLNDLHIFSRKVKSLGIEMINLTDGGVVDVFRRMDYKEIK